MHTHTHTVNRRIDKPSWGINTTGYYIYATISYSYIFELHENVRIDETRDERYLLLRQAYAFALLLLVRSIPLTNN